LRDAAPDFEWADTSYSDNYVYAAPVGSYPSGITPEGVLDLAGNVWEWTSSLYWAYPYQEKDGRENAQAIGNRSLRGGGWGSDAPLLRCTNRRGEKPELRFDHTGFRVVRDP
jgi:formylglycine-generating enzyme required for sulfatase activity